MEQKLMIFVVFSSLWFPKCFTSQVLRVPLWKWISEVTGSNTFVRYDVLRGDRSSTFSSPLPFFLVANGSKNWFILICQLGASWSSTSAWLTLCFLQPNPTSPRSRRRHAKGAAVPVCGWGISRCLWWSEVATSRNQGVNTLVLGWAIGEYLVIGWCFSDWCFWTFLNIFHPVFGMTKLTHIFKKENTPPTSLEWNVRYMSNSKKHRRSLWCMSWFPSWTTPRRLWGQVSRLHELYQAWWELVQQGGGPRWQWNQWLYQKEGDEGAMRRELWSFGFAQHFF